MLYFIKEYIEFHKISKAILHLQTNQPLKCYKKRPDALQVGFSETAVHFAQPFLEATGLFEKITYGNTIPNGALHLTSFRNQPINLNSGLLPEWYYQIVPEWLPQEFWKPVCSIQPDYTFREKAILIATDRYQNEYIDYGVLKRLQDQMIFLGLPSEHKAFLEKYGFAPPYHPISNLLEVAKIMMGAKGIISNQGGFYCLAEILKVPRILVSPEFIKMRVPHFRILTHLAIVTGPHNNIPLGGHGTTVQVQERLLPMVEELLRRNEKAES